MIVLGPMNADLNGAPPYWRTGNWRPYTLTEAPSGCVFTTVPFDKCDLVFEYDARLPKTPLPEDQGWKLSNGSPDNWKHEPERGTLRFSFKDDSSSFWSRIEKRETMPDRAVAYGLFRIERDSGTEKRGGLDFVVEANPPNGRSRGMRANWTNRFLYRPLDNANSFPIAQPAAEPTLLNAWHRLGLDAELMGPKVRGEDVEEDDGGKTIGSLDGLINNDDRRAFRYGPAAGPQARAVFGKTDPGGPLEGEIRNFVGSFPGRFMRAGFRAVALGNRTRLRFIFCADPGARDEPGSAAFLVRYATPRLGLRPASLPLNEAPRAIRQFDASNIHRTVEVPVDLANLTAGEELWFTIERDWRHEGDKLRATVHLLMVIIEEVAR